MKKYYQTYKYRKKKANNRCIDCNKFIKWSAIRCKKCFGKSITGKNNPMFGIHRFGKEAPNYGKIGFWRNKKRPNQRKILLQMWKDINYIKLQKKVRNIQPNKSEKLLNKILQKLFPREYKYVGDWSFIVDGLCPDFINCNGQKKIIELFGDYWHRDTQKRDKNKISRYAKYGYKTLIIWEHELKNLDKVKKKIKEFHCG